MTVELDLEESRNRARFVARWLGFVPGWHELSDTRSGNTWRWINAIVYSVGAEPILVLDGWISDSDTGAAEVTVITEDRVVRATGLVDGSYPHISIFTRQSLSALEILEPGLAIENNNYLMSEPSPRLRLTYGSHSFNVPLDAENAVISREVDRVLPLLFDDLLANSARTSV